MLPESVDVGFIFADFMVSLYLWFFILLPTLYGHCLKMDFCYSMMWLSFSSKNFNDVLVAIWQTCHKLGWGLQGSWWTLAAFQWVRASLKNPITWLVDASGSMQENCIFVHMVYKAMWKICRPSELVSLQILKYKIWVSESTYEVAP